MAGRIVRFLAVVASGLTLAVAILYALHAAGVRLGLDGSGVPRLVTFDSRERSARALEAHREEQRVTTPPSRAPAPDRADPDRPLPEPAEPDVVGTRPRPPYWTGFRGPSRDGHYRERPILTRWPAEGLRPLWKQPVGGGYASFAIANGRAFTIEQRRAQEVVTAYDTATGREIWAHGWNGEFREWQGGDGPRATPAWFDGRVYALGALGELRSLDEATGRLLWRTNILDDGAASNLPWGMAASPLVFDDLVVVIPGGPAGRSIAAYDRHTGASRWSALTDKGAYSSPVLATLAGRRQIVAVLADRAVGIEPDGGDLLWSYPWPTTNHINASQPVIVGESGVLLSSSYGQGAALLEVTSENGRFGTRLIWETMRLKNRFSSSIVHEGFVYGLDEAILTCLDAATGEPRWKGGRYGHGQLLLASGHLVILSESGDLALVRATPERHDEIARFPALEGKTWNHPALDDGRLLVRNLAEMAAFDLRPRRAAAR